MTAFINFPGEWDEGQEELQPTQQPVAAVPSSSTRQLDIIAEIGRGSFAKVYRGRLHHEGRGYTDVAVKQFYAGVGAHADTEAVLLQAQAEAKLHASFKHPNIVKLEETRFDEQLHLILEWCRGGSLRHALQGCRRASPVQLQHQQMVQRLKHWQDRLQLLIQATDAVSYLHSMPHGAVLHNDLRADNMVLQLDGATGACALKLCDFGLAVRMPNTAEPDTAAASSVRVSSRHVTNSRWVAPEVLADASGCDDCVTLSRASDVYSLAAVMAELMTGRPPHDPEMEDECMEHPVRRRDVELFCMLKLQAAANAGTPRLLRFPAATARLACPQKGSHAADPLRGVFEACSRVRIDISPSGEPKVAPIQQQLRPSAAEVLAALARWPYCEVVAGVPQQQQQQQQQQHDVQRARQQSDQDYHRVGAHQQQQRTGRALHIAPAGFLATGSSSSSPFPEAGIAAGTTE